MFKKVSEPSDHNISCKATPFYSTILLSQSHQMNLLALLDHLLFAEKPISSCVLEALSPICMTMLFSGLYRVEFGTF
ncbi:hypothetical protein AUF78_10420 [archaeon 13_1_20CM_2_51_12]|nr:MAG: hypothetical protein AUF78_10420 [archaeon 13_1_20CM_2_51_12]